MAQENHVVGVFCTRAGCRSVWCPRCGPVVAGRLRRRLRRRAEARKIRVMAMATLTVSPKVLGANAQGQYVACRERRLVSRFARELSRIAGRSVAYVSVMEFHRSGHVHFHLLIDDFGRLPKLQLKRLQAWCQRNMGTMDWKFKAGDEAIRYVTKYVSKASRQVPAWVLDYQGVVHLYSTSHGYWGEGGDDDRRRFKRKVPRESVRALDRRLDECEQAGTVVLVERMDVEGEVRRRYVGVVSDGVVDLYRRALSLAGAGVRDAGCDTVGWFELWGEGAIRFLLGGPQGPQGREAAAVPSVPPLSLEGRDSVVTGLREFVAWSSGPGECERVA